MKTDWKPEKLKTDLKTKVLVTQARSLLAPGLLLLIISSDTRFCRLALLSPQNLSDLSLSLRFIARALVCVIVLPPLDDGRCLLLNSLPPANSLAVFPHMTARKGVLKPKAAPVTSLLKARSDSTTESTLPTLAPKPCRLCPLCPGQPASSLTAFPSILLGQPHQTPPS